MYRGRIIKLVRYLNQIEMGDTVYDYTPKPLPYRGSEDVFAQVTKRGTVYQKSADGKESYHLSHPEYLSLQDARDLLRSKIDTMKTLLWAAEKLLEDTEEG